MSEGFDSPVGADLAANLEATFRLLGRRVYAADTRGLDRASAAVLAVLAENDAIRPSDVAAALELDVSTISRRLAQLEDGELIRKTKDDSDGRSYRLSITEHGLANLMDTRSRRAALLNAIFEQWNQTDQERLLKLANQLLADLQGLPPFAERRGMPTDLPAEPIGATL